MARLCRGVPRAHRVTLEYSHPRELVYPVRGIETAYSLFLHNDPKCSGGSSERFLDVGELSFDLESFLDGVHGHPHLKKRKKRFSLRHKNTNQRAAELCEAPCEEVGDRIVAFDVGAKYVVADEVQALGGSGRENGDTEAFVQRPDSFVAYDVPRGVTERSVSRNRGVILLTSPLHL